MLVPLLFWRKILKVYHVALRMPPRQSLIGWWTARYLRSKTLLQYWLMNGRAVVGGLATGDWENFLSLGGLCCPFHNFSHCTPQSPIPNPHCPSSPEGTPNSPVPFTRKKAESCVTKRAGITQQTLACKKRQSPKKSGVILTPDSWILPYFFNFDALKRFRFSFLGRVQTCFSSFSQLISCPVI